VILFRFVIVTITTEALYTFSYVVPPTAHHDFMLNPAITAVVGPPPRPGGSPNGGVGSDETVGCSEGMGTPTLQV